MRAQISLCAVLALLLAAGSAHAQGKPTPPQTPAKPAPAKTAPRRVTVAPRAYLSVNGGYQATSNDFSDTWTFDYYADTATTTASYRVKGGFLFDAGGGFRMWRDLLVGAAVSHYSTGGDVSVTASVPHPFNFTMRDAQGGEHGLGHAETSVHLHAMWMLRASARVQVGLFGGPSMFSVRQALVTQLNFNEAYPYDTVSIASLTTAEQSKTLLGYNVGADLTYSLSRQIGLGVLIRLARAKADFDAPDKGTVSVNAGGAQVAGGLRVRF
jgi:hypothetical protein